MDLCQSDFVQSGTFQTDVELPELPANVMGGWTTFYDDTGDKRRKREEEEIIILL